MNERRKIGRVIVTHRGREIVSDIRAVRGYGVTCCEAGECNGAIELIAKNLKAWALDAPRMARALRDPGYKFVVEMGGIPCAIDAGFDLHGKIWAAWRELQKEWSEK